MLYKKIIILVLFFVLALCIPQALEAEEAEKAEDIEQSASIHLDKATTLRGYTFEYKGLILGIMPKALEEPTELVVKKRGEHSSFLFNFLNKQEKFKKPVFLALSFSETSASRKKILVREIKDWLTGEAGDWREIESNVDYVNGLIKGQVEFPQLEVKIVEDDQIMEIGYASWYRCKNGLYAASPDWPRKTKLKVTNLQNQKSVIIKVNDYGPDRNIHPDRVIDLDLVAFKEIANPRLGLVKVRVEPL